MAADRLDSAWRSYWAAIAGFYEGVGPALEGGEPLDDQQIDFAHDALDTAASSSEQLREACVELLEDPPNGDPEEIETLLLAAAALDAMLASDGLQLDPEGPGRDESFTEGAGDAERQAEPRGETIAAATYLYEGFLGISGAADPSDTTQLRAACLGAVDTLVSSAARPALWFTFHALEAPAASFVTETLETVAGLTAAAGRIRQPALRLLREALRKVVAISAHREIEKVIDRVFEPLSGKLSNVGVAILGRVAGRADAEERITESIAAPDGWTAGQLSSTNRQVIGVVTAYVDQMKWAGRVASWIARAAPIVSVLAAPVGALTVTGINATGLGFVAYTLTVRLGSRSVPHPRGMTGIVAIVDGRGS